MPVRSARPCRLWWTPPDCLPPDCAASADAVFRHRERRVFEVIVQSFGFRTAFRPRDLVFDVRFLPNPYYEMSS
ncbi:MAG: hypothetical protein ACLRVN_04475 [Butyricicoccus sp.]